MKVDGTHYRSIWFNSTTKDVGIIDQRWLPSEFRIATLKTRDQFANSIRYMWVRGIEAADYMAGNLLKQEVEERHVAEAFLMLAQMERKTDHVATVDGGNVEASRR